MFHLQPGTGVGFTGSREMALGLGGTAAVIAFVPGGGLDEDLLPITRKRDTDDLEILLIMVAIIENDR